MTTADDVEMAKKNIIYYLDSSIIIDRTCVFIVEFNVNSELTLFVVPFFFFFQAKTRLRFM